MGFSCTPCDVGFVHVALAQAHLLQVQHVYATRGGGEPQLVVHQQERLHIVRLRLRAPVHLDRTEAERLLVKLIQPAILGAYPDAPLAVLHHLAFGIAEYEVCEVGVAFFRLGVEECLAHAPSRLEVSEVHEWQTVESVSHQGGEERRSVCVCNPLIALSQ